MRVNLSQRGRLRASNGTAAGCPPRYPIDSANNPTASTTRLLPTRNSSNSGGLTLPRQGSIPSPTNRTNSVSGSYDGKRSHHGVGSFSGPELDLNGSTSLNLQSQLTGGDGEKAHLPKDALAQAFPASSSPLRGHRRGSADGGGEPLNNNISRDNTETNGVLLGSLAEYTPASAVSLANAYVTPQVLQQQEEQNAITSHINSGRVNSAARGDTTGAGPQDLRTSRQSITVLRVTRDGALLDNTRPPSSTSLSVNGSVATEDVLCGPTVPPRRASLNQIGSGHRQAPPPRVQREAIAPITLSDASTSTNQSAPHRNSMPSPSSVTYQQQARQQQQQQQPRDSRHRHHKDIPAGRPASCTNTATPEPWSHPSPAAPPSSSSATRISSAPSGTQRYEPRNGELTVVASCPRHVGPANTTSSSPPARNDDIGGRGAVLHHRPSPAVVARQGDYDNNGEVLSVGAPTLQISTTTLTKTSKKVRYLLPSESFDPDAPDAADQGGLTEAEEEALLDPVNYTRAADSVAGRYPMLLRRSSAQGGDLLHGRRGSSSGTSADRHGSSGGPHPTFLLDDGNRWARETNRPTVATTRNPAGSLLTQLPSPSILHKVQKTSNSHRGEDVVAAAPSPFPAYKRVGNETDGTAGGYLLQRHVQQMATGKRLVAGTVFETPPMTQRQRERREREEQEASVATAAGNVRPPRRPTDGLYEEIIRRTNQNRRSALPTKVMIPTTGGTTPNTIMPALAPPSPSASRTSAAPPLSQAVAAAAAATESADRRRGRPHPNSDEPTPLHKGSGARPSPRDSHMQRNQQQQPARMPPRSSSQPYITNTRTEGTPNVSDVSGVPQDYNYHYYNEPSTKEEEYYAPAPVPVQQQQRPPPPSRRPLPPPSTAASRPYPPSAPPPPSSQQQHQQQRRQRPPPPSQRRPPRPVHDSPPPQLPSPPFEAVPNHSVASTTPNMLGYTSGRFSKYNPQGSVLPPPPPPTSTIAPAVAAPQWEDIEEDEERVSHSSEPAPVYNAAAVERPLPPPPPQQQQQPPSSKRSVADVPPRHTIRPPPPPAAAAAAPVASAPAFIANTTTAEEMHPLPYDDDYTDEQQQQSQQQDSTYEEGSYPYDEEEEPVTDAAGVRTPRRNVVDAGNSPIIANTNNNNSTSFASASAEVRRSLIDQYNVGDDEGASQDTLRDTPRAPPPRQKSKPKLQSNVRAERAWQAKRENAPQPQAPQSTSTAAPVVDHEHDAPEEHAKEEIEENSKAAPSADAHDDTDTETQPVTVSERGSDEMNEEDDLVKKGPLVLKLGDEVYAEEGYLDEEGEGEYYEEEAGEDDNVKGGEEEYWESPRDREQHGVEGKHDGHPQVAESETAEQQNRSARYHDECADEL